MSERVQRLVGRVERAGLDAVVVSHLVNVRYLTGYTGSNGLAVVGPDLRVFLTDFRYAEQAAEQVERSFDRQIVSLNLLEAVRDVLGAGELRVGFEEEHVSVKAHAGLVERLGERVELIGVSGMVEDLRAVKDEAEVARIAAAAELADAAVRRIVGEGLAGRTEREVAMALEQDMRRRGALRPSFDTIVAAGPHGALPHASPRDIEIRTGDLVVVDWGAELDGYCSDCTRTYAVGEPSDEARHIYELVLEAQVTGLHAVHTGISGRDADAAARTVIERAGHGEHFGHGLGHGVGIEIHEAPRLSQRSEDDLRSGQIVTVEPGVYLPGRFGVRIEDLVVVGDDGARVLTGLSKDLTVIS